MERRACRRQRRRSARTGACRLGPALPDLLATLVQFHSRPGVFIARRAGPYQGFFAHLIEHQIYTRTDRTKGKFRSFLLAAVKNFLIDAYHRESAFKRGGAHEFLPLHDEQAVSAEALFQSTVTPGVVVSADYLFERQWAETLVGAALQRLADEFAAEGKGGLFRALEIFLRGSAEPLPSYDQVASRLGMPAATIRSHVTRMRARYREVLRAELRHTVETEAQVDEELGELLRVLTAR